jgi:hypothetical protein
VLPADYGEVVEDALGKGHHDLREWQVFTSAFDLVVFFVFSSFCLSLFSSPCLSADCPEAWVN